MTKVTTDPIADMLTRIRNALLIQKEEIVLPHSKVKEAVATILQKNNFIDKVTVSNTSVGKDLHLVLIKSGQNPHITEIARMSTPGRRHYVNSKEIPIIKQGRGIVVITTSQGMMTGDEARKKGLGGELICKVY